MPDTDPYQRRLDDLRRHRVLRQRDLSLSFLKNQFKRQIEKPYKQLGELAAIWPELVPSALVEHTFLEGFSRGVLRVAVDSSAHLFELDRLLRQGLEQELIKRSKRGTLRRVQLYVVAPTRDGNP